MQSTTVLPIVALILITSAPADVTALDQGKEVPAPGTTHRLARVVGDDERAVTAARRKQPKVLDGRVRATEVRNRAGALNPEEFDRDPEVGDLLNEISRARGTLRSLRTTAADPSDALLQLAREGYRQLIDKYSARWYVKRAEIEQRLPFDRQEERIFSSDFRVLSRRVSTFARERGLGLEYHGSGSVLEVDLSCPERAPFVVTVERLSFMDHEEEDIVDPFPYPLPKGFDVHLIAHLENASDIPTIGRNVIIIASVKDALRFRILDDRGKIASDADEKTLAADPDRKALIHSVRGFLKGLWPPHSLTQAEKEMLLASVTWILNGPSHERRPLPADDSGLPRVKADLDTGRFKDVNGRDLTGVGLGNIGFYLTAVDWDGKGVCEIDLSRTFPSDDGFELRLMPSLKDVSGVPNEGNNQIIVASIGRRLHFRMFDGQGRLVVDADETGLTDTYQKLSILGLRDRLDGLWPPHILTKVERREIVLLTTSIVGHTPSDIRVTVKCTEKEGRDFCRGLLDGLGAK